MKKILIVDDEDNMRKILSLALKKRNYEVATASSAIEGLKKISGFSPDMIVSDIKMDKMNGLEFLRNIRINYGGIPVCFITAYGSIQGAVEAMKLGAVDYLEKPFDIGSLIEIIEENSITAKEKSEKVEIIGSSEILKNILKIAKKVANTDWKGPYCSVHSSKFQ
jgi:DNA-binding NtrC family response regulator